MNINELIDVLNGDLYLYNDSGEADTERPMNRVSYFRRAVGVGLTLDQILTLMAIEVDMQNPDELPRNKNLILAARMSARMHNLLKPNDLPATHHVRYSSVTYADVGENAVIGNSPFPIAYDLIGNVAMQSTNIICLCAYIFRSRGHHYLPAYDDDIERLWGKNTNAINLAFVAAELALIFTRGLHCIYPDDLDRFWAYSVGAGRCCNPYVLRFRCPCAGTAVFFAIYAGMAEALRILPGAFRGMEGLVAELTTLVTQLMTDERRWQGGINRIFYNAEPLVVSENRFTPLAAVIYAMNSVEDAHTNLGKSQSLQRVANRAQLLTQIVRSTTAGIMRQAINGEVQNLLGGNVLRRLVFEAQPIEN